MHTVIYHIHTVDRFFRFKFLLAFSRFGSCCFVCRQYSARSALEGERSELGGGTAHCVRLQACFARTILRLARLFAGFAHAIARSAHTLQTPLTLHLQELQGFSKAYNMIRLFLQGIPTPLVLLRCTAVVHANVPIAYLGPNTDVNAVDPGTGYTPLEWLIHNKMSSGLIEAFYLHPEVNVPEVLVRVLRLYT